MKGVSYAQATCATGELSKPSTRALIGLKASSRISASSTNAPPDTPDPAGSNDRLMLRAPALKTAFVECNVLGDATCTGGQTFI